VRSRSRAKRLAALAAGAPGGSAREEREFRRLAVNLGVDKAEELLAETKKKLAEIVKG
jgi:hypothetical protein